MNDPGGDDLEGPNDEATLAELSEQITQRLQAGDPVPLDGSLDRYPVGFGRIAGFLPTLRSLSELGRSMATGRRPRRPVRPEDRR